MAHSFTRAIVNKYYRPPLWAGAEARSPSRGLSRPPRSESPRSCPRCATVDSSYASSYPCRPRPMMLRIVLTSCAQSSPREAASRASSSRDGTFPCTFLCRCRAHLFALQPHVRRRPADRAGRLRAGLVYAVRANIRALPLLGSTCVLIFLGRYLCGLNIFALCAWPRQESTATVWSRGPRFVCGGHL